MEGSIFTTELNETNKSASFFRNFEKDDFMFFMENYMDINSSDGPLDSVNSSEMTLRYNISDTLDTDWRNTYKPILDFLLLIILIVVMLSMGCEITWQNLFNHVKKPIGLLIGIFSQFGIMPLSAFCILLISGIQGLHATGVLIISCCPGGVLSNTFTYFCEGNLALSVAMTCASTLIAMCMMPLNIWLYGRRFESEDLVIPYERMALSLITVTSPVVVGMLIKWKFPRIATVITKLGGYSAILIMFICIAMEIVLFPNMFYGVPAKLYIVILSLPIIGLTLGYGLATVLKQNKPVKKTIAIECGVQNVPVALTIIALSFPLEMQEDIVLLPWMYGFAMMSGCTVICIAYRCSKKFSSKEVSTEEYHAVSKLDSILDDTEQAMSLNGMKVEIKPGILKNKKQVKTADV